MIGFWLNLYPPLYSLWRIEHSDRPPSYVRTSRAPLGGPGRLVRESAFSSPKPPARHHRPSTGAMSDCPNPWTFRHTKGASPVRLYASGRGLPAGAQAVGRIVKNGGAYVFKAPRRPPGRFVKPEGSYLTKTLRGRRSEGLDDWYGGGTIV